MFGATCGGGVTSRRSDHAELDPIRADVIRAADGVGVNGNSGVFLRASLWLLIRVIR